MAYLTSKTILHMYRIVGKAVLREERVISYLTNVLDEKIIVQLASGTLLVEGDSCSMWDTADDYGCGGSVATPNAHLIGFDDVSLRRQGRSRRNVGKAMLRRTSRRRRTMTSLFV